MEQSRHFRLGCVDPNVIHLATCDPQTSKLRAHNLNAWLFPLLCLATHKSRCVCRSTRTLRKWRAETVYHDDMPYERGRPSANIAHCERLLNRGGRWTWLRKAQSSMLRLYRRCPPYYGNIGYVSWRSGKHGGSSAAKDACARIPEYRDATASREWTAVSHVALGRELTGEDVLREVQNLLEGEITPVEPRPVSYGPRSRTPGSSYHPTLSRPEAI